MGVCFTLYLRKTSNLASIYWLSKGSEGSKQPLVLKHLTLGKTAFYLLVISFFFFSFDLFIQCYLLIKLILKINLFRILNITALLIQLNSLQSCCQFNQSYLNLQDYNIFALLIDIQINFDLTQMYGFDDYGTSYPSVDAMWEAQLNNKTHFKVNNPIGSLTKWYQSANKYWSNQQSSYNGVLGGYGNLSQRDINFSNTFLKEVIKMFPKFQFKEALDCGAGIGRITKQLLSKFFKTCDLVDQCQTFINKSKQILKDNNVRHFYCKGLQDFKFEHTYDCIWIQWVLTHLNDEDNIAFLIKAKAHLSEGGVIIVKENCSEKGFYVDKEDCTVVRSSMLYRKLFEQAGMKIIKEERQPDWPTDLFEPVLFALV